MDRIAKSKGLSAGGRDARIRLAMFSSIVAKGGGLALQIVALPMIVRVLGPERFGVFSLVSSVLGFIAFAQFGVGGYLIQQIATKLPEGDFEGIRKLVWTSLVTVGTLAVIISTGLAVSCHLYGLEWLWGVAFSQNSALLTWGFYCVLIIGSCSLTLNILSGCQAGYQELHLGNIFNGTGNVLTALGLVIVAYRANVDERVFWMVLYGVPLILVLVNVVTLLRRHTELHFRRGAVRWEGIPALFRAGAGFMVVQTLLPLLQREGARVALARQGDMVEVAHLGAFLQFSTVAGGVLVIFTQPLYGAIADATARSDQNWTIQKLSKIRGFSVLLGAVVCGLSYFCGPWVFKIWLGKGMELGNLDCFFYSVNFIVTALLHVHHVFLLAQGKIRAAVWACFVEILLLSFFLVFFAPSSAGEILLGLALIQIATSLPLTSIALKRTR